MSAAPAPALQRNIPWLLLALAWIIVPHVEHLPPWITLLCVALGIWRWIAARRGLPLPNKWLLLALALTAGAGVLLTYRTITGRDAGVALLIVMLSLKLMEMRSVRDGIIMIFLGYFLVITNFLYSQSIPMGLYMLVAVLAITATLIGLNLPAPTLAIRPKLRLAAVLLAQGLPVMVVLFVLFPRAQSPLWGTPAPVQNAVTGLSNSMSPGDISRLGLSSTVAFRAEFSGAAPAPELRYWRGPVFWHFDGRTWSAGPPRRPTAVSLHVEGAPLIYTITLEPHDQRWLFALDFPLTLPPSSSMSDDFQVLAAAPARQRLRYQLTSQPKYRVETTLHEPARRHALQLPAEVNPQARKMAQSWRANARSGKEIVNAALELFSREAFFYTLSPPPLGFHAVDDFLFGSRRGFCEHYAGSFVFLMRAAGVPARVVTGYQGGEHNPIGNYLIVRQSDAHAWAEVWLENEGWVRIDPTARIAPRRVAAEGGLLDALPASEALPVFARMNPDWLRQLRFGMDLINYNWYKWVLGYNHKRQFELLSRLGMGLESARGMIYGLLGGIGGLMLIFAAAMLWRLRERPQDPAVAAYWRFCARLAQAGLGRREEEGPAAHAARVVRLRPDLAAVVARISGLYITLRYQPLSSPDRDESLRKLRKLVWLFRP